MEAALMRGEECIVDLAGAQATQSFVDELVGVLILRHGPDIVSRIISRACSPDVYLKTRSH